MPSRCITPGCKSEPKSGNSLFSFPFSNEALLEAWTDQINQIMPAKKRPWKPSKHSRVCSKHFKPTDVIRKQYGASLEPGAIPIFKSTTDHLHCPNSCLKFISVAFHSYSKKSCTPKYDAEDLADLKRKIHNLQKTIIRKDAKIKDLTSAIKDIYSMELMDSNMDK